MKLYIYVGICFKQNDIFKSQYFMCVNMLLANNNEDALGYAYTSTYTHFPKKDGYYDYQCQVKELILSELENIISQIKQS
jgi:hypothetical protein